MTQRISDSRKIKAAETKNNIYRSAYELFRQYGFEQVSVSSIVEKAGISKGAFYVHFESKDSLVGAMISEYIHKLDINYRTFLESFTNDTSASDIMMALVEKIADNIACDLGYTIIKFAYRLQIDRTIDTDVLLNHGREIYHTFSNLVSLGMQQGEFKTDIPAEVIADHLVMSLRGYTYEWCIRYPDFDLKKNYLQQFQILLYGIKKK